MIYLAAGRRGWRAFWPCRTPCGPRRRRPSGGPGGAGVTPVLLTGDHENAARHIAGQLGIRRYRANCLPEDKLDCIDACQGRGSRCA